jgi:hypothetical protein
MKDEGKTMVELLHPHNGGGTIYEVECGRLGVDKLHERHHGANQ